MSELHAFVVVASKRGRRIPRHVRGRSLTAFAGYLWPTGGDWTTEESWAGQPASWSDRHPLAQSAERLTGVYAAVAIAAEGTGCITSDPLGLGVLYLAETDDISVVSNRRASPPG